MLFGKSIINPLLPAGLDAWLTCLLTFHVVQPLSNSQIKYLGRPALSFAQAARDISKALLNNEFSERFRPSGYDGKRSSRDKAECASHIRR